MSTMISLCSGHISRQLYSLSTSLDSSSGAPGNGCAVRGASGEGGGGGGGGGGVGGELG